MTRLWVARPDVADVVGDLPGVTAEAWDEPAADPPWRDEVEFYVPALLPSPASLEVMARMPGLRVVQLQSAGFDHVLPHIPDGVTLCNARGVHDAGTAEWVVGAAIASLRDFPEFAAAQREGRWAYHRTGALTDSRVLIVGYGAIGQAVERRLEPFEVQVTRVASRPREGVHGVDELPGLLPHADVVVVLVPGGPRTRHLFDAALLARMRDGALLVNAARGPVVDTAALLAEAERGRLRAALDVTDPEPLPDDHPLWRAPGVFVTPHVGGSTPASSRRIARLVRDQARRHLAGEPLRNVVGGR